MCYDLKMYNAWEHFFFWDNCIIDLGVGLKYESLFVVQKIRGS
jgi:hypothetical protein